jgi:FkbM family methyltransferase
MMLQQAMCQQDALYGDMLSAMKAAAEHKEAKAEAPITSQQSAALASTELMPTPPVASAPKVPFFLRPVMPAAHYLRRFLVQRIEPLPEAFQESAALASTELMPAPPIASAPKVPFFLRPVMPAARYLRRFLVQRIESLLETLQGHLFQRYDALKQQVDVSLAQQAELKAHVNMVDGSVRELNEYLSALNGWFGALKRDFGALNGQFGVLNREYGELNEHIGRLNWQLGALTERVDDLGLRSRGALPVDDSTYALRTYDGFVLVPRQDTQLLLMLLDAGPQGLEPGTRRVLMKLLAPGMTFVDVGAHVGLLTLAGARAVGPTGKVLAIEPVPLTFELLTRALVFNRLFQQVELKQQAAGARREHCKFFVSSVLGHSSLLPGDALGAPTAAEIEVDVSPLDELVQPGERVDLVKIDVEGTELAVLEGMTRIIADNPELAIIAEFGPPHLQASQTTAEQWFSAFRDRGFDPYAIDELSADCQPADVSKLASIHSINILFGPRDRSVLARLSS